MKKIYMLTGRSVRMTNEEMAKCAEHYTSLRALAHSSNVTLSYAIARLCQPDIHGGVVPAVLILSNASDLTKGRDGSNAVMQLINTVPATELTILRYKNNHLSMLKAAHQAFNFSTLYNRLVEPVELYKLALVNRKWARDEYADFWPSTEYGTDLSANRVNAVKKAMQLIRNNQLIRLELVTDRWTKEIQTMLWLCQLTYTEVKLTWERRGGAYGDIIKDTNLWLPQTGMELNEFLDQFAELNVYRYDTISNDISNKGQRITRYARPSVYIEDDTPIITEALPEDVRQAYLDWAKINPEATALLESAEQGVTRDDDLLQQGYDAALAQETDCLYEATHQLSEVSDTLTDCAIERFRKELYGVMDKVYVPQLKVTVQPVVSSDSPTEHHRGMRQPAPQCAHAEPENVQLQICRFQVPGSQTFRRTPTGEYVTQPEFAMYTVDALDCGHCPSKKSCVCNQCKFCKA